MNKMRNAAVLTVLLSLGSICRADDDEAREAAAVRDAKVTPIQAVEIALKQVPGGIVFEMEVEIEDGVPVYEVRIAVGHHRHTVDVGCETGQVLKYTSRRDDIGLGPIQWQRITIPITQAMETALARTPGCIIDVDLSDSLTHPRFAVDVFNNGKTTEIEVDTTTGQIVKIHDED